MRTFEEAAKILLEHAPQGTQLTRTELRAVLNCRSTSGRTDDAIKRFATYLRDIHDLYLLDGDEDIFFLVPASFLKKNVTRRIPAKVIDRYRVVQPFQVTQET